MRDDGQSRTLRKYFSGATPHWNCRGLEEWERRARKARLASSHLSCSHGIWPDSAGKKSFLTSRRSATTSTTTSKRQRRTSIRECDVERRIFCKFLTAPDPRQKNGKGRRQVVGHSGCKPERASAQSRVTTRELVMIMNEKMVFRWHKKPESLDLLPQKTGRHFQLIHFSFRASFTFKVFGD